MLLTEHQKEIISALRGLLIYGGDKLSSTSMDFKKVRSKKQVLFLMMGAAQSYSEAILKLLASPPMYDKASEVLFRALMETAINLGYIYSDRSQLRALTFMIYSSEDKIDFANKHKKLMQKYPTWDLVFGTIAKPEDWDNFIDQENKKIDKVEKYFKKQLRGKFPPLTVRAERADAYLKQKGKLTEKTSLESQYVHYYKHFSQVSHLTMPGLEQFFRTNSSGGRSYAVDDDGEGIERIGTVVFAFYLDFLRFFLKEYKIYDKDEFKSYARKIKSMVKSKT